MIYICGDSFGVPDPDYGQMWAEQLAVPVVNLCAVSASNLLISRQLDRAIADQAAGIIVLFTSCTRGETKRNGQDMPWSWHTASEKTTPFSTRELSILQDYFGVFHDLELAIDLNRCVIESSLYRLEQSGIPFVWDQGGFEHASMGGRQEYFAEYAHTRSDLCLWDLARTREYRPYYHITDPKIHQRIADYYNEWIHK